MIFSTFSFVRIFLAILGRMHWKGKSGSMKVSWGPGGRAVLVQGADGRNREQISAGPELEIA